MLSGCLVCNEHLIGSTRHHYRCLSGRQSSSGHSGCEEPLHVLVKMPREPYIRSGTEEKAMTWASLGSCHYIGKTETLEWTR